MTDDAAEASVGGIGVALDEAVVDEAVDDAGDGRKADAEGAGDLAVTGAAWRAGQEERFELGHGQVDGAPGVDVDGVDGAHDRLRQAQEVVEGGGRRRGCGGEHGGTFHSSVLGTDLFSVLRTISLKRTFGKG